MDGNDVRYGEIVACWARLSPAERCGFETWYRVNFGSDSVSKVRDGCSGYRDRRCSSSVVSCRHASCVFLFAVGVTFRLRLCCTHMTVTVGDSGRARINNSQGKVLIHHAQSIPTYTTRTVTCPPSRACRPRARYPLPALQRAGPGVAPECPARAEHRGEVGWTRDCSHWRAWGH